ncbi:hypothetical protein AX760_05695 [Pararhizobium antarcticum]|uniref:RiboL-PSP-HEPN domain-containing protein n=2 Tax=Pararhizobium antarcticum TaxID=1798805 RepID=A0A657LNU9_9HYPH|nr:hypothetical protein AX760_05695 [Pararhizobium antarcticum]
MSVRVIEMYGRQLDKLSEIIDKTNDRVISDPPDELFADNINFYTKSYLINLCAITEACLKDTAMVVVRAMIDRISSANISNNIVFWGVFKDGFDEKKHSKFEKFALSITEKSVSDKLSANPWRAIKLFELLGCDIKKNADFEAVKGIIASVVDKRNNIVHHNDQANDISLSDVKAYIDFFRVYIYSIDESSKSLIVP